LIARRKRRSDAFSTLRVAGTQPDRVALDNGPDL